MVMVARNGKILAGNNEDWKNPKTYMWFTPATEKYYGRICFGFDRGFGFTQGGMNDQGLFIDGNALRPTGWKADPAKKRFSLPVIDYVLANCATVEDVIKLFEKYNHPSLARARFPVADAKGNAAIMEWSNQGFRAVKRQGWYQISTNFVQSNFKDPKSYPCHRYKIADKIFAQANQASVDVVRSVLSATHAEYSHPTVYSFICDLKERVVYVYNFHNFEAVRTFNLREELKKGKKSYFIPDLFLVKTQAASLFDRRRTKLASDELLKVVEEKGVKAALEIYHRAKKEFRKVYYLDVSPLQMALLADKLNDNGKTDEAIAILEVVLKDHPNSQHPNFIYAYALSKKGETQKAIRILKMVLARFPRDNYARDLLQKLLKK
jgi:tetratricopeptide (TPR) repeat protein